MILRTARRILDGVQAWRLARRVQRAAPEIVELRRQIAERSRQHRNAAPLRKQLRDQVIANLSREQAERKAS